MYGTLCTHQYLMLQLLLLYEGVLFFSRFYLFSYCPVTTDLQCGENNNNNVIQSCCCTEYVQQCCDVNMICTMCTRNDVLCPKLDLFTDVLLLAV